MSEHFRNAKTSLGYQAHQYNNGQLDDRAYFQNNLGTAISFYIDEICHNRKIPPSAKLGLKVVQAASLEVAAALEGGAHGHFARGGSGSMSSFLDDAKTAIEKVERSRLDNLKDFLNSVT